MGWWMILFVVLGAVGGFAIVLYGQLFRYRRTVRPELPIQQFDGIPLLIQNELPYPGRF